MNICLVNNYFPPYVGGIETYIGSLATSLAGGGHKVTVYCSSRPLTPEDTVVSGVRVVRFSTPLALYGAPIGVFPSSFFKDDYDVIHCNFPNPYFASVSALMSSTRRIPAILTWHNDLPVPRRAASLLVRVHDTFSPVYLDLYKYIIATTSVYARKSRTLKRYSSKVRIVPNGVDTQRFNPEIEGSSIREKYHLQGLHVVLFVGALTRWHSYKGVDLLLEAFALSSRRLDSLRLVIVGGGDMLETYKSMARNLKVDDRVVFAGHVDDAVLPSFYAACDVTVLSSRDSSEGFGLVLLEAMASGKPVIGTDVGGVPELVRDKENGMLVEPNNPQALAEAITSLCADDELREAMGRRGREFSMLHSWRDVAVRVESIYRDSMSQ